MKLEEQVCSLELAKEMKELGFKQDSLFLYKEDTYRGNGEWTGEFYLKYYPQDDSIDLDRLKEIKRIYDGHIYSAFTVAELGEMLPGELYFEKDCSHAFLEMIKTDDNSYGYYYEHITGRETPYPKLCDNEYLSETEADARTKCLIYLKKNNLI